MMRLNPLPSSAKEYQFVAFSDYLYLVMNILPFPALDGGRIVLVLIEVLRGGRRLKPEFEGLINFIGMAVLLTLMVVVTISDVTHW
jgi:regulator of sigma E protease